MEVYDVVEVPLRLSKDAHHRLSLVGRLAGVSVNAVCSVLLALSVIDRNIPDVATTTLPRVKRKKK